MIGEHDARFLLTQISVGVGLALDSVQKMTFFVCFGKCATLGFRMKMTFGVVETVMVSSGLM